MDAIAGDGLRAHVVWVPKLGGSEPSVAPAAGRMPGERATHYWDPDGWFMSAYRPVLGLPGDAWDVYLVYGPGARWEGSFPQYVWCRHEGVFYEARLTNKGKGEYKGYPITEEEARELGLNE